MNKFEDQNLLCKKLFRHGEVFVKFFCDFLVKQTDETELKSFDIENICIYCDAQAGVDHQF